MKTNIGALIRTNNHRSQPLPKWKLKIFFFFFPFPLSKFLLSSAFCPRKQRNKTTKQKQINLPNFPTKYSVWEILEVKVSILPPLIYDRDHESFLLGSY